MRDEQEVLAHRLATELADVPPSQWDVRLSLACPDPALREHVRRRLLEMLSVEGGAPAREPPRVGVDPGAAPDSGAAHPGRPRVCPRCQATYPPDIDFCPRDGAALAPPSPSHEAAVTASLARRFRIIRELGGGGMGKVFLAEQLQVGRRLVAVKVVHRRFADSPEFLLRFRNEAASTGRIRHPNVVTVYESGEGDDGTPYLAMEYLEGETLGRLLRRRQSLSLGEIADIVHQAARGLNAAHALGIVHRDIKPDNVFLTQDEDGRRLVKVMDFGLARLGESTVHSVTGLMYGTPPYLSYEQASGMKSDRLDARSDIYSLGVVAYELITGRAPFKADTPLGYVRKHLSEPPPPFATVNPSRSLPGLEAVVARALEKDRERRYQTVLDFARALTAAAAAVSEASTEVVRTPPPTEVPADQAPASARHGAEAPSPEPQASPLEDTQPLAVSGSEIESPGTGQGSGAAPPPGPVEEPEAASTVRLRTPVPVPPASAAAESAPAPETPPTPEARDVRGDSGPGAAAADAPGGQPPGDGVPLSAPIPDQSSFVEGGEPGSVGAVEPGVPLSGGQAERPARARAWRVWLLAALVIVGIGAWMAQRHFLGSAKFNEYSRQCEGGVGSGCMLVGDFYELGSEIGRSRSNAAEYYERARSLMTASCGQGDGFECRMLAAMYEVDFRGVAKDEARQLELLRAACGAANPYQTACEEAEELAKRLGAVGTSSPASQEATPSQLPPSTASEIGTDGAASATTASPGPTQASPPFSKDVTPSQPPPTVNGSGTVGAASAAATSPGPMQAAPIPDAVPTPPSAAPVAAPAGERSPRPVAGLEWVPIPGTNRPGTPWRAEFEMGCVFDAGRCYHSDLPRHRVTLTVPFALTATEVTVRQYSLFSGALVPPHLPNASLPALEVSRTDAERYCQWAGGRLPTEAEWEYSARGGRGGTMWWWGNDVDAGRPFGAWSTSVSPVGRFKPNPFGLFDMFGNATEWVADQSDRFTPYSGEPRLNPGRNWQAVPGTRGIIRGASYRRGSFFPLSARTWVDTEERRADYGIRCARDITP